jgi:sodium-dependent phosphate cotransporter
VNRTTKKVFWVILFVVSLYSFLLSITLLGDGLKLLGHGFTYKLISLTSNPILGLFIGLFTTAVVQSSSATTSIVVGMVASGALSIFQAIPIVMGANIGTTVTNVLVSLTHITRKQEFQRAFPAATVHDFFNILTVLVVLPLEIKFHILYRVSGFLANIFQGIGGVKIGSPLKVIVSPLSMQIVKLFSHKGVFVAIFALVILFVALKFLVDAMRALTTRRLELIVDQYLFGRPLQAFLIGLFVTAIIQSSSVTTSLVTPLVGAGILTIYKIFPYVVGANIGTTVTAILASLVTGNILAVQVAFAHLVFNVIGCAIWLPARIVPITLAKALGKVASYNRFLAIAYIIVVFYLIPITIFLITKLR